VDTWIVGQREPGVAAAVVEHVMLEVVEQVADDPLDRDVEGVLVRQDGCAVGVGECGNDGLADTRAGPEVDERLGGRASKRASDVREQVAADVDAVRDILLRQTDALSCRVRQ
jgi:hypothetical protein